MLNVVRVGGEERSSFWRSFGVPELSDSFETCELCTYYGMFTSLTKKSYEIHYVLNVPEALYLHLFCIHNAVAASTICRMDTKIYMSKGHQNFDLLIYIFSFLSLYGLLLR